MPLLKLPPRDGTGHRTATPVSPKRGPHSIIHLAQRIFETPLAITPTKAEVIVGALAGRLGMAADAIPVIFAADDGDFGEEDEENGYTLRDGGVAYLPIYGTLVKRSTGMDARS